MLSFINEVSTIVDRLIKIAIYVDTKNFGKRFFHILRYIRTYENFFLRNTFIANKARQNRGEPPPLSYLEASEKVLRRTSP